MKDLVFVKFNSKLRQRRENKTRDPIVDETEQDGDNGNEWITGITTNVEGEQEQVSNVTDGVSSQGTQGAEERKRKRACQSLRNRKKKKLIPVLNDEEASASSSSEDEDDNDTIVVSPTASISSSDESLQDDFD